MTLYFALPKHAREELVSTFHETYQDVMVENMGFFYIQEGKAVKSHSLTKAGSVRIMNLDCEHWFVGVFFLKTVRIEVLLLVWNPVLYTMNFRVECCQRDKRLQE